MKSQDICQQITQQIIAELEKGIMPWSKPWGNPGGFVMPRRHTGARYRGINILLLWARSEETGCRSPYWMTFQQALEYGGHVRKGEKGTPIVYANKVTKTETRDDGETVDRSFGFLKSYTVFNSQQIDNLPAQFALPPEPVAAPQEKNWESYGDGLTFFERIPAQVTHGGSRAVYIPSQDRIELPNRDAFQTPQQYLSVRAHETAHWTKSESRLNRDFGRVRWGDHGYAMEELVAEVCAAFTMAEIGLIPAVREDHAPYIGSWLEVLRNDHRALLTAAAKASDALEYMCRFQPSAEPESQHCAEEQAA
jgi:antirestriction protein ArdC